MSTHKKIDLICVVVIICAVIITILFMNGEKLGLTLVVDEDSEYSTSSSYFTANDLDGSWDTTDATVITLEGDSASVSGDGAFVSDGCVYIARSGKYTVSGSLTNGSIIVDAEQNSKIWIMLNGVQITREDDAAFIVDQADKVFLTLSEGSENTLSSGSAYSDEALDDNTSGTIFSHDDLTINGSGSLTVNAEYKHGIVSKDDLVIAGGTINVTAPADGMRANDCFKIASADITVTAGDDGFVVNQDKGYFYMESGTAVIDSEDDAIHTATDVTICGGKLTINAKDDAIHSDTNVSIADGTVLVESCYEGIEALIIDISGGDTTIYASDDGLNANGGSGDMFGGGGMQGGPQMQSDTGTQTDANSQTDSSAQSSSGTQGGPQMQSNTSTQTDADSQTDSKAQSSSGMQGGPQMQSDTSTQTDADSQTDSSAQSSSGTQGGPQMQGSGFMDGSMPTADGTQTTESTADTSEESEETYINISGGSLTIINETGQDADGLDSNGDIFITGGTIRVSLTNSGTNSAIDYASESGGVCEISGGTVIAAGSYSMAEQFDSTSEQCSILYVYSAGAQAGSAFALLDESGDTLLSWDMPCSFSAVNISCPEMTVGGTYTIKINDQEETVTLEEVSSAFGDAQSGGFGGSMNFGGMTPSADGSGGAPSMPDGEAPSMPDGEAPSRPDGGNTNTTQGNTAQSDATQSSSAQSDTAQSSSSQSDTAQGNNTQSDATQSSTAQSDTAQGSTTQNDATQTDAAQGGPGMPGGSSTSDSDSSQQMSGGPGQGMMPGENGETADDNYEDETSASDSRTALSELDSDVWVWLGISIAVLIAGLVFAILYRKGRL